MTIIFETPRLIARQMTENDAALILDMNSDPEVLKYLHERPLLNEADARQVIRDIIMPQYKNKLGRWAIQLKENIGWCGLKHRPEIDEIDLGYRFKKNTWGRGYATEAARETLSHGFNTLGLREITGRAHIENIASINVLEKIGMQFIKEEVVDDCPVKTFIANCNFT